MTKLGEQKTKSTYLIYAVGIISGIILLAGWNQWIFPAMKGFSFGRARPYDRAIAAESDKIWTDENALYSYIKKFGGAKTMQHLNELGARFGDCHQNAHKAGRLGYEVYGEKAFREGGAECHSGWYHGATEAYFKEHGTANLEQSLNTLCSSELNPFFSHQCIHGIGHGLMAWTSYDLPEALKSCDLLSKRQDSCWTGVFMENIVGGLAQADVAKSTDADAAAHFTKYLSKDPQYPCDDPKLGEKYKGACYFLQTSRMIQIFGANFEKVAAECAEVKASYQPSCYGSMGRDVGGVYRLNAPGAIAACNFVLKGDHRIECINGAVQDAFWDPTGQDAALHFCQLLTDKGEKDACYQTIFGRAPDVLTSKKDLGTFCNKAEDGYQKMCKDIAVR